MDSDKGRKELKEDVVRVRGGSKRKVYIYLLWEGVLLVTYI